MGGRLDGRVAVVTGGGNGIGRGIVRRFAAEAAKVLVAELDEGAGRRVAEELGDDVRFFRADVSRKEDNVAMIDHAARPGAPSTCW